MSKLKYGMATASAIAAFVGVAGLSLPQALAGNHMGASQASDLGTQQQSLLTERAKIEYEIRKQECDTLKNNQPDAYEPCLEKAQSTRDNLLTQTQGSEDAGQGSQELASNQSQRQFSGQEQGPIDKMTAAVKEKLADWGIGSSDQGRESQPSAEQGQQGQGSEQGFAQGQQFQSGGTQGLQGSSNQGASPSGSAGARGEHMDRVEYFRALAHQQYVTLTQECNTLKKDPNVYEQCVKHAESVRDKIAGMAKQG